MFRLHALAVLGLVLLSGTLVPTLTAQQVPDEVREIPIPEGVKEVKYTKVRIDGETFWKITGVIDEKEPPPPQPGISLSEIGYPRKEKSPNGKLCQ